MAAPRYRIGNDLTVLWAINNRDGSPFDMNDKEVRLFVVNSRGREEVEATLTTMEDGSVDNVIRWDFSGDRQRVTGLYALEVEIKASDTHKKIKKDICEAFVLVSKSEMESNQDEGEPYVYDGGMLVLSSRLDVFRFGIAKIEIGTNGNWYIDNVDTGVSALGGGPGLVSKIYNEDDFGKSFDKNSVIDTFNAYAIESLRKKIEDLKLEDLKNVLSVASEEGDVLTYKNGFWRSAKPTGGSGGGTTEPGEYDEQIEAIINSVLELGSRLSLMWQLSDDGNQIITDREVIINNNAIISGDTSSGGEGQDTPAGIAGIRVNGTLYTDDNADGIIDLGVISGGDVDVDLTDYYTKDEADAKFISTSNIGSQSVAKANTATSATKLANKRKLWGQEFDGSADIVGSLTLNAIAGTAWYRGIKFMDSSGTTQLSFIGAYGTADGFQYAYIGGTHTSPHFSIDANGKAKFFGVLEPKMNVYCANSVYVRGAHLMLGNKEEGIYLTKTGIWWHDANDSWTANLLGFSKTEIKAYQTLRPNTNSLCALGTSDYRWSGVHAVTGDFSGNVTIKGASTASMTEGAGALNIGSGAVLMLDANDIQAKASGTTTAPLYINSWGGALYLGHADYSTRVYGYLSVDKALSVTGNITCAANLIVTGNVGIGITTPTHKLDVNGSINVRGTIDVINTTISGVAGNPLVKLTLNSKSWYCQAYTTNGTDGIFLGSTSSKSLKVDVDGNVYCPKNLIVTGDVASA